MVSAKTNPNGKTDMRVWQYPIFKIFDMSEKESGPLARQYARNIQRLDENEMEPLIKEFKPADLDTKFLDNLNRQNQAYLLALPFSTASLWLINFMIEQDYSLRIISTPLSRKYIKPFIEKTAGHNAKLMTSLEMIKDYRIGNEKVSKKVYLTFPDHHTTSWETMLPTKFFESDYYFSAIETALFNLGLSSIVTFSEDGRKNKLSFSAFSFETSVSRSSISEIKRLLSWISEQLRTYIARNPETILSWKEIYFRNCNFQKNRKNTEIKFVESFIREWHLNSSDFNQETYDWAVEKMSAFQKSVMPKSLFDRTPANQIN